MLDNTPGAGVGADTPVEARGVRVGVGVGEMYVGARAGTAGAGGAWKLPIHAEECALGLRMV